MFFMPELKWNKEQNCYFDSGRFVASVQARHGKQAPLGDHF